jgi:hypothetical protein
MSENRTAYLTTYKKKKNTRGHYGVTNRGYYVLPPGGTYEQKIASKQENEL